MSASQAAGGRYSSAASEFDEHFLNAELNDGVATLEIYQRCYFEAELFFDQTSEDFLSASIKLTAVHRRLRRIDTTS
ncbi:hypothetical protein [uncultured Ramlibacter sp.]|uniref:hypothetical protein n=1 Tax=uncultured Ramlibacter sp. TaxID=260755 RepID=UPI0026069B3E|nr:hypothetical protein [uncultured Ramlibacter sp.]